MKVSKQDQIKFRVLKIKRNIYTWLYIKTRKIPKFFRSKMEEKTLERQNLLKKYK